MRPGECTRPSTVTPSPATHGRPRVDPPPLPPPPCLKPPLRAARSRRRARAARSQQQYLVRGALYLLVVPAHRATDEEADEVLLRWLDALQSKAPGAAVQLVLSHCDRLDALQAALASHTRREDDDGEPLFESALEVKFHFCGLSFTCRNLSKSVRNRPMPIYLLL